MTRYRTTHNSEMHHQPAHGYVMGERAYETRAFAKRRAKNRIRNRIARLSRRKNRS